MGTVWLMNLLAAALKGISLGLSTVVTAGRTGRSRLVRHLCGGPRR
jgi:hypothetical protein